MKLHEKRNESYPQDIEEIATKPPRGNVKQLRYLKFEIGDLNSDRSDGEDEPKEDETLLDTRTAPNNGSARTREETNRDIIHPVRRIAEKGNEAIDHRRHMNRHRLKESRQIKPEPCYLFAALVLLFFVVCSLFFKWWFLRTALRRWRRNRCRGI